MTNARISTVNPSTESEVLAPQIVISWDPQNNDGQIVFSCQRYYRTTGSENYFGVPESDGALSISLGELMQRTVSVDSGGSVMVDIPMTQLMDAVKVLFDQLYNEMRQTR